MHKWNNILHCIYYSHASPNQSSVHDELPLYGHCMKFSKSHCLLTVFETEVEIFPVQYVA